MARILVVDDDPDVLRVVEKVLSVSKHEVFTANDAIRAMDLLNASRYDLLITDANMPQFSGFELVRTIKNNKRFERMSIAMLTGLREKKDIEKAIRAGVDDYIIKPIDPMLLLEKVDGLFRKKPPTDRLHYDLPAGSTYAVAQIATEARLIQLNELGLILHSNVEIAEGTTVQVMTDFFRKLEIKNPPPLKVVSCRKTENGYEINVAFVTTNDAFYKRVRVWIGQATRQLKGAA